MRTLRSLKSYKKNLKSKTKTNYYIFINTINMTFFRATGVSEVLVTARYLMKTRRLHRQRLQQSDEELAAGILMLPQAETAEEGYGC